MAGKNVNKAWHTGRMRVAVEGSFRPNGSGTPVAAGTKGRGYSIARTSVGLYTITFDNLYNDLDSIHCSVQSASAVPVYAYGGDYTAASKTLVIRTALGGQGYIPLDITSLREIDSNAIQNLAAHGGLLASDSVPALERINGATDKALRVDWAKTEADEVQFPPIPWPADLQAGADVTVHLLVSKDANTDDTAVIDIQAHEGIGDTEMGGNCTAMNVAANTLLEVSTTLANTNITGHPGMLNLGLVPGTHANDAVRVHAAWLEYSKLVDMSSDANATVSFRALFRDSSVDA